MPDTDRPLIADPLVGPPLLGPPLLGSPLLGPGLGLDPADADAEDLAAAGGDADEAAEADARAEEIAAERYAEVDALLQDRWPEARIDPGLERIRAFCEILGDPQRAVPAIHLTGTNGKTSTARMTETLLRGLGLRTGTFTSPHLQETRERIAIDGRPLSRARFVEVYDDVEAYLEIVDGRSGHRMSFFEAVTGMAFAAFADAPVDVSVLEVGLGGSWDATNVADGVVAVLTRIDVDHAHLLGDTPEAIAAEKVGIIKAGAVVVSTAQLPEVDAVIDARVAEVGATLLRAGRDFEVTSRAVAVGGQLLSIRGIGGSYPDLFLPLHGSHQADNAACAIAATEAFFGGGSRPLRIGAVRDAFGAMTSPGRLELVAHQPTVLLDAAHNPHGARAAAAAVTESYTFSRLVGVVGIMADKDAAGVLAPLVDVLDEVVVTENSTERALPAEDLAELAERLWPAGAVHTVPDLEDALATARRLAADGAPARELPDGVSASPGVLVTGSVVTVGQARALLLGEGSVPGDGPEDPDDDDGNGPPEVALDGAEEDDERVRRSDEAYDGLDL